MFVMTMQPMGAIIRLLEGGYYPQLCDSYYAYLSHRMTMGYRMILNELANYNQLMSPEENCIWAWASAPCYELMKLYSLRGYGCVLLEIDEEMAVFTDYDAFSEYALEDTDDYDFFISRFQVNPLIEKGVRIQASFTMEAVKNVTVSPVLRKYLLDVD